MQWLKINDYGTSNVSVKKWHEKGSTKYNSTFMTALTKYDLLTRQSKIIAKEDALKRFMNDDETRNVYEMYDKSFQGEMNRLFQDNNFVNGLKCVLIVAGGCHSAATKQCIEIMKSPNDVFEAKAIAKMIKSNQKPYKVCSRCHKVRYCSKLCQNLDWVQHQFNCLK